MTKDHLPLWLAFAAFVVTFLVTRIITRMIRAGRGPFRNNVSGGVHIHHAVPGIVLLITGGFVSVAAGGHTPGAQVSAVMIGIGASLVLDEFALILHLQDVYWQRQGQLSVQVVTLTAAVLGLVLLGFNPFVDTDSSRSGVFAFVIGWVINAFLLLIAVGKGKYASATIGVFVPFVGLVAAIRLARPNSLWARRRYSPEKMAKATSRSERFERSYGKLGLSLEDLVAGRPTAPATGSESSTGRS